MIQIYSTTITVDDRCKKHEVEHAAGLRLLVQGLQELYGITVQEEEIESKLCKGPHGKPALAEYEEIHFNISHTDGFVVCGFADAPIGVDVELVAPVRPALPKRVLTEEELSYFSAFEPETEEYNQEFFRFWTLKESYMKWDGSGFAREPQTISFAFSPEGGITSSEEGLYFYQEIIDHRYILAVCSDKPAKINIQL